MNNPVFPYDPEWKRVKAGPPPARPRRKRRDGAAWNGGVKPVQVTACPGCGKTMCARSIVCEPCWTALPEDLRGMRVQARTEEEHQYAMRALVWRAMHPKTEGGAA